MADKVNPVNPVEILVSVLIKIVHHIRTACPSVLGSVERVVGHEKEEIFYGASFAKTISHDSLDLVVALKRAEECLSIRADLVRGGSGEILAEMEAIDIPDILPSREQELWLQSVIDFLLAQEPVLLQDLR